MQTIKPIYHLLVVISIFLMVGSEAIALEGKNLEKYNRGKAFIYENVGEGIYSMSNFEKGISLLEGLLEEPDVNIDVHLALADAYRTMAIVVFGKNSQGRTDFFKKEESVLELAVKLEPINVSLLERYAFVLKGEERARINRKILAIDANNAEAYLLLGYEEISLGNNTVGIEYIKKAYELSQGTPDRRRIRDHLERVLIQYASKQEIVELRLRNLREANASTNSGLAKLLKISLEFDPDTKVFEGDLNFAVVFSNTGQQTIVLPNYTEPDLNKFWFSVLPEAGQKSLWLRNPQKVDIGESKSTVEIAPGKSFRIKTKLSDLFPTRTTRLVEDGGYIMFLQYLSPTRGHLYSEPVHFEIRDFINNETAIREDDFTLAVELNGQETDVSGDFPLSLVFSNNSDKAIKIYAQDSFVADFYTFFLKKNSAGFETIPLPRLDRNSVDFYSLPTLTIEPGEQHRFKSKFSELAPNLKRLDDGKYGLSVVFSSGFGNETVFNGRVKSKYIEFNVRNVE